MLTDDRVAAHHGAFLVEIMHRAAETLRAARRLAEKLGHAGIRAHAAHERVAVVTVGGDHVIVGTNGRHGTSDHCFLADVEMAETADAVATLILLGGAFLETPDEEHLGQHPKLLFWYRTLVHK